jgi:polysaccharide export outer membrane protein
MKINNGLVAVIGIMMLASCVSNKKVVYMQELETGTTVQYDSLLKISYPKYRLQVGDIINLDVRSSDPTATVIFLPQGGGNNAGQLANSASDVNYLTGITINENGDVELPLVGYVNIQDKTLKEAKEIIETEITRYILDPYVLIRLGGIPYTAIGEFRRPGRYSVLKSNLTIFEAVANAGDLTVLANRKNTTLIRQYPNGQRVHLIDLTDRELIRTPFYYVQPNDQIYVQPLKVRQLGGGIGVTGFQSFIQALTLISTTLLIIVSVNTLNK